MEVLTVSLLSSYLLSAQAFIVSNLGCSDVVCRPGRECRSEGGAGEPRCVCTLHCPEHWNPVCGSDGVSYDNHCLLHRTACMKGSPTTPLHPGFCRKERERLLENLWKDTKEQEVEEELNLWEDTREQVYHPPVHLPNACFENDRDRLREL